MCGTSSAPVEVAADEGKGEDVRVARLIQLVEDAYEELIRDGQDIHPALSALWAHEEPRTSRAVTRDRASPSERLCSSTT